MTGFRRFQLAASVAAAAVFAGLASPALAYPPVSRGEQWIQTNLAGCMQRAGQVFQALGWANVSVQGPGLVLANKGIHSSYIACNDFGTGYSFVNVFVASDGGPGEVPGRERVALQQGMAGQLPAAPTAGAQCGGLRVDKLGPDRVRLSWNGSPTDGDEWFTVVPAGSDRTYYGGRYLRPDRQVSGSREWGELGPGNWEYRFYTDDNDYIIRASCPFSLP